MFRTRTAHTVQDHIPRPFPRSVPTYSALLRYIRVYICDMCVHAHVHGHVHAHGHVHTPGHSRHKHATGVSFHTPHTPQSLHDFTPMRTCALQLRAPHHTQLLTSSQQAQSHDLAAASFASALHLPTPPPLPPHPLAPCGPHLEQHPTQSGVPATHERSMHHRGPFASGR